MLNVKKQKKLVKEQMPGKKKLSLLIEFPEMPKSENGFVGILPNLP